MLTPTRAELLSPDSCRKLVIHCHVAAAELFVSFRWLCDTCSSRSASVQQSGAFLLGHDIRKLLNCGSFRGLDTVKNILCPS